MVEIETKFYMFSEGFNYCSKDRWQFCNFLHKLTGGGLVIKHTIFLLFLTCSTAMKPIYSISLLLQTLTESPHYSLELPGLALADSVISHNHTQPPHKSSTNLPFPIYKNGQATRW